MAPPIGTSPTAMIAIVARSRRGADSALIAIAFGMTPPMPMPASKRSQDISVVLVDQAAMRVKMPKTRLALTSAALRP